MFPPATPGETAPAGTRNARPRRHVLLVEDHLDSREFMQSLLESDGHTVEAVRTVDEGRERLADVARSIDVLVTDIGLPDGSGWDLVAFASRDASVAPHRGRHRLGAAQRTGSRVRLHPAQAGWCDGIAGADCGRGVKASQIAPTPHLSHLESAMPDTGSIRILIAEDDDNSRALLVDLLNSMGHVVVAEVTGGREAIERRKDVVPTSCCSTCTCPTARDRGGGGDRQGSARRRRRAVQRRPDDHAERA
jgi:CheY-like chemotaxis protein